MGIVLSLLLSVALVGCFFFRYALELEKRSKIYEVIPVCKCHLIV